MKYDVIMKFIAKIHSSLDYFFPRACLLCGARDSYLCQNCLVKLPIAIREVCPFCKRDSDLGLVCSACEDESYLKGCLQLAPYLSPDWQKILRHLKFQNLSMLAPVIGQVLSENLFTAVAQPRFEPVKNFFHRSPLLVPVPMHHKSYLKRPYNQVNLLAQPVAKKFGLAQKNILSKKRKTTEQVGLDRIHRLQNLHNAFKSDPAPKRILLCDDVLTTGATLNEAARTLKSAGAQTIWALAFFYD